MKKLLLILLFLPMISFGQSYCSSLNIVDITTDGDTIITFAISDESSGSSYPYIAYSINALGDTTHTGYLDLYGNIGFDTTSYSYAITSSPIYPLSVYYVYGIPSDTCVLHYHPSCDSVSTYFDYIDSQSSPSQIHITIETLGFGDNNFGYGGFILLNEVGDTIAAEDINNAGNVYGLMQNNIENRSLELFQNISIPFSGTLHLISGFFAGVLNTSCIFPFYITKDTTSIQKETKNKLLLKAIDLLGREVEATKNSPMLYIYDDGTVEKKVIIE